MNLESVIRRIYEEEKEQWSEKQAIHSEHDFDTFEEWAEDREYIRDMKVYLVFEGSSYPYANGEVAGVFSNKEDAENVRRSIRGGEAFIEEHAVIQQKAAYFKITGFLREPLEDNLIVKIVNEQAEDTKLWLGKDIEYVREKLRELHAAIENEAEENDEA